MRWTFRGKKSLSGIAAISLFASACGVGTGTSSPSLVLKSRAPASSLSSIARSATYADAILADSPSFYWRLGDAPGSGSVAEAVSGLNLGALEGGAKLGAPGALAHLGDTAVELGGSSALITTGSLLPAPNVFSLELWFRSSARRGGLLLAFCNAQTGPSSIVDRAVFLQDDGKLSFGVQSGGAKTLTSAGTYQDGQWHYVVASLSGAGMTLYVDGLPVASDSSVTGAKSFNGYWRMGSDDLSTLSPGISGGSFAGSLAEVAVYTGKALSSSQVQSHFLADQ